MNDFEKKPLILVVDDDPKILAILTKAIQENGYQVVTAKNGSEGLGLLKNAIPDLIISDVEMPVMDGFTFGQIVKSHDRLADIPFVFLTVRKNPEDIIGGMKLADGYYTKPFQTPLLISEINSLFRLRARYTTNGRNGNSVFGKHASSRGKNETVVKPRQVPKVPDAQPEPTAAETRSLDPMAKSVKDMFGILEDSVKLTTADHVCNQAVGLFQEGKFLESLDLIEENLRTYPSNYHSKRFIELLRGRIDTSTMKILQSEDHIPAHGSRDGAALANLHLSPLEFYVFSLIDGRSTIKQLDTISSKGKYRTNLALVKLLRFNLITLKQP